MSDERLAEIRRRHRAVEENVAWAGICVTCDEAEPCDANVLLEQLAAAQARAECLKALERRVARLEREAGKCYCMNCIVIG